MFSRISILAAFAAIALSACSKGSAEAGAGGAQGAAGAGGRPGGGRPAQTLTLAQTDVAVVRRESIVDGVPITGNLRPIETVDVRARVEGELVGVYAREGDFVRSGQLLARFESSEQESTVQSAAADRAAAQGELSTAEWGLEQAQQLYKAGAIPETDLRVARNAVATARARLAATNSRMRSTSISTRDTRVLAPTSGMIEKRMVEGGEHVARGAQLFTLVRNDILELAAAVPERKANSVRIGQRVQFLANGLNVEGRVARLSPTVDPASRSVTVYVQIPNAGGVLKGGTFASGTVLARTITNALVVPVSALRQTAAGSRLVYKLAAGVLDTATVQVGVLDERLGIAEALSGVAEGDSVVSGNVGSLGKGMKVTILGAGGAGARSRSGR